MESLPRDNKRQHINTTSSLIPIKSIPQDLLLNVVARVSSRSYIDHYNMKVCCRDFFIASKENYMWQQVSLEKFPLIPWSHKEAFDSFMQSCKESGNIEALYRVGLQELKSFVGDIEKGMKGLKMAAEKVRTLLEGLWRRPYGTLVRNPTPLCCKKPCKGWSLKKGNWKLVDNEDGDDSIQNSCENCRQIGNLAGMEESESEAVFDALNLNPQLFCNEVLNNVDDVLDEAFCFFYQDASTKLNIEGTQRSQDLKKGVDCIRQRVQSVLDKQLGAWENYVLRHCFSLPRGFRLPNTDESTESGPDPGAPFDPDIDAQLDSLREKLTEVAQDSEMLNQEIQLLETKSSINAGYINEAVQLYEQNSMHELFEEIVATASELEMKMGKLNSSMIEETDQMKTKRIYSTEMDLSAVRSAKGLSNEKLDNIEEFVSIMKST
ncbi:hypothetical protein ACSQ67_006961 [Phaseolus vulgaris]